MGSHETAHSRGCEKLILQDTKSGCRPSMDKCHIGSVLRLGSGLGFGLGLGIVVKMPHDTCVV